MELFMTPDIHIRQEWLQLGLYSRLLPLSSDRPASTLPNLTQKRDCKDIINVYKLTFTFSASSVLDKTGNWLKSFLAPPTATRGKEGSGSEFQKRPKDLGTIVTVVWPLDSIEKTIKTQINCLVTVLPGRTQLFSNLSIVMRSFGLWTSDREEYLY
jgi:hypothetical protein